MFIHSPVSYVLTFALVSLSFCFGCRPNERQPSGNSDEPSAVQAGTDAYDPHDVPLTEDQKRELRQQVAQFPGAVETMRELRDVVEAETKNGIPVNPHEVHQALDKADLVLQWLPAIARDSGVPKEHWEEVTTTANELRTLFESVHENIDNKQDPDFAAVAGEIAAKLDRLAEIAQAQPSANGETRP